MTNWNELPDEALSEVAKWLQEPREMAKFSQVDQRSYRLASNSSTLFRQVVSKIPDSNIINSMTSWKHLAFYEEMKSSGWLQENRVGFAMASTTIASDDDEHCPIKNNSRSRLEIAAKWFQEGSFPEPNFILDSHCGTLGPRSIAVPFSRRRGVSVVQALLGEEEEESSDHHHGMQDDDAGLPLLVDNNKLEFRAWGRRISDIAGAQSPSSSPHPYAEVARQGYGWAEVYFDLDGLILPQRPEYYQGISPEPYRVDVPTLWLNYESESDDDDDDDDDFMRVFLARERHGIRQMLAGYRGRRFLEESEESYASSSDDSDSVGDDTDDGDDHDHDHDNDEMDYDLSIAEDDEEEEENVTNDDTMLSDNDD